VWARVHPVDGFDVPGLEEVPGAGGVVVDGAGDVGCPWAVGDPFGGGGDPSGVERNGGGWEDAGEGCAAVGGGFTSPVFEVVFYLAAAFGDGVVEGKRGGAGESVDGGEASAGAAGGECVFEVAVQSGEACEVGAELPGA